MSIRTSSINRTLYQRNNLMATISLYNSRSLLDAQYKTGNYEKVCVYSTRHVNLMLQI
jgi:hypothetical protein